ncbi:MAG: biotin--[Selenomonadaceae bacterium]|nr:biotin--[acetyl-CoA-carboxylase] ligase [Selenomonadaceae bacterium]
MKRKIIDMLKDATGNFVSGESIAEKLNVTRTSVWKNIQALKKFGYDIESRGKLGYKLNRIADLLLPAAIQSGLGTKIIAAGNRMVYKVSLDSTNKLAKQLANAGAEDGTVVVAEEQTGGKGRLERNFFSPRGKSILFSLILRPRCLPKDAPKFTLMAAVAVANTMQRFNLPAQIKWPNDIMFDGRKVVGILTEMSAQIEKVNYIVVGIGINANIAPEEFPPEIKKIASSLAEINGGEISRVDFFRALLEECDKLYRVVNEEGFQKIFQQWRRFNITLGHEVKVIAADTGEIFFGVAEDIDEDGALIVSTANGRQTLYAGDVSIRDR